MGLFAATVVFWGYFYFKFDKMIEARLRAGAFSSSVDIFTAPRGVSVGDQVTAEQMISDLRRSGYSVSRDNPVGYFHVPTGSARRLEVYPGRGSFAGGEPAVFEFANGHIAHIVSLADNTPRNSISLGPQLIANLSSSGEKRRLERFADLPPDLIHAVVSAEDKHFFHHTGFDSLRILKAAYVDLRSGRKEQGASTLTMQLARGFFLDSDKRWKRKIAEFLITSDLEHKLTKQQIFEDYANQVYLGRSGPFSIHGFGEASRVFFGKDLSQVNNSEAALLAGIVQRPSYFNPFRYSDRAKDRRDIVLGLMHENQYLSDAEYQQALATPVKIAPENNLRMQDQYFVDVMNNELQSKLDDHDRQTRYIYTTLDPDLQRAAEEAVTSGMEKVDALLKRQKRHEPIPAGQPQVALVALDPRTGEIKALLGGRNYGTSQLNHALAMRQPGSVFKPFVYAAALDTAISGGPHIFTAATILNDEPTTFADGARIYQPSNFKHEFMGDVTLRTALAHSLNVSTVSLAEQVGFNKVVAMAHRAGLNENIRPTPSVALGSYETTPLEIAGAYTMFANQGVRVSPTAISLVRAADGSALYQRQTNAAPELDPRVNYLMVSLLQEVLRTGTGAGIHSFGFNLPAAGKTGTSRDGWFAGFTNKLLCVVWVGFDDNRELNLEGAHSALPIWAEFMKRAASLKPYKDPKSFVQPSGIVSANICMDSGQLAGQFCPRTRPELFIDGTEPAQQCPLHSIDTSTADRVIDPASSPEMSHPPAPGALQPSPGQPSAAAPQSNSGKPAPASAAPPTPVVPPSSGIRKPDGNNN
ncbi:MAG TPA: PBP1A family penicillin-binding protein [Bryobacteraceae bacterium]|nr:PBP1A family penicillin-binding protein [Bryobacteraceae bacterium]